MLSNASWEIGFGQTLYRKDQAKQKHPGCKKVRGQSEAVLQIDMCDQKL